MHSETKPLYTLTIGEFITLTKQLVEDAIKEKLSAQEPTKDKTDEQITFNIKELADFLHCSKVSIHKYKKKGLPFYRIGRKILFKKTEVLNFMKSLKGKRLFRGF